MMKMTYKIVFTPSYNDNVSVLHKDINFLCSDGKLHIRLRDYDHEEVIHGFINKLTYLVTYLFQRSIDKDELSNNIIEKFVNSDSSIKDLDCWLLANFAEAGKKYKGLKIFKNYRKIKSSTSTSLGSFIAGSCPLKDGITYGDLHLFAQSLGFLGIEDFLLNDSIDLVITKDTVKDSYSKFVNKSKKIKKEKLEYIPLF